MTTSNARADPARRTNGWLRRAHRWLGIGLAAFVFLLSCTGIAINHSDNWNLDSRYVTWSWLLDAYGIRAPEPSANFSDRGHYAALLGRRLFFDQREIADNVDALTGLVVTSDLAALTTTDSVFVLTTEGDLVEKLDLSQRLPGAIEALGRLQNRAVIYAANSSLRSDTNMTQFEAWSNTSDAEVIHSQVLRLPDEIQSSLQNQYRGRGLSIERLLTDVHSGRFVGKTGPLFMDTIAILLMLLSATGVFMWIRGGARKNGSDS